MTPSPTLQSLHDAITSQVHAVTGVSVDDWSDKATWKICYDGGYVSALNDPLVGPVVQQFNPVAVGLQQYAASVRYTKETGGVTINGATMPTDRQTQAQLAGACSYAQANPTATIQWKLANGSFVTLSAAQITSIAMTAANHVQACFAVEQQLDAGITASPPTITDSSQVDAAFAAITT